MSLNNTDSRRLCWCWFISRTTQKLLNREPRIVLVQIRCERERDVFRWVVLVSDHDLMRILWLSGSGWLTMSLIVDLDLSDCLDKNTEMWIFFFSNNLKQFQHSCSAPVVLLPSGSHCGSAGQLPDVNERAE